MDRKIRVVAVFLAVLIPSVARAQQGGCWLVYDGIDDQVRIPYSGAFPVFEYTITAWIKANESSFVKAILTRGEDETSDVQPWGFGVLGDGRVYLQIEDASNSFSPAYPGTTAVDDGSWHHVAATRALNGDLQIYVDGILDASYTNTWDTQNGAQTMGMGFAFVDGGSGSGAKPPAIFFDGALDEITLWTVHLTATDVAAIAVNGLPTSTTGLQAHWQLDDGSGQTATDTVSGFDGTLGTMTTSDSSDPAWQCAAAAPGLGPWGLAAVALALLLLGAYEVASREASTRRAVWSGGNGPLGNRLLPLKGSATSGVESRRRGR